MLRNIFITLLFIGTVCAMHLEYLTVDLTVDEELNDESLESVAEDLTMVGVKLPGKCWICTWAIKNVKKHIGNGANAAVIKEKLQRVCDGAGFLKGLCKWIIRKYLDTLTEELSTNDDPATICANINMCKPKPPPEFIQTPLEVEQKL